jgi:protein tyrosine phosphatase
MNEKIESKKILEIVNDYKNRSNKDLELAMDFISADFNNTKETVIKMINHIDKLEKTYNILLKEYNKRNGR